MMTESDTDAVMEPDWDAPIKVQLTPAAIIHALFPSADGVHTGWETCVDHALVTQETNAVDNLSGNHCRLAEQEYVEDHSPDVTWHDWVVELKLGEIYIAAHWRTQQNANPADWDWCMGEAENAFASACVLVGKRTRRGLMVEDPPNTIPAAHTRH